MEHESFEDEETADLLNAGFISVKVDREERPDVDAVYMAVCQALTGSGGWPLTIVMTPEQKPFFAATYLPKRARYGQIGMLELLPEIMRQWKSNRQKLLAAGEEIASFAAGQAAKNSDSAEVSRDLLIKADDIFRQSFDKTDGGFGRAPKFPTPHNLLFLLRYAAYEKDTDAPGMVEKTLVQMYRGGIFDHIGGGFSRYSTDDRWLAPHFEKMLYDNALLTYAYLSAYETTGRPLYRQVAEKTISYVLRELTDETGGFYCGQDADSDGVEGKYYLFEPREVKSVLGEEDGEKFCRWFDITEKGNFEGKSILNLLQNTEYEERGEEIERARSLLYDYRLQRTKLHKDDKVLTSWNALMIGALARAFRVLEDARCLQAAQKAQRFLAEHLTDGQGRLLVRWRAGSAANPGLLDDYAFVCWALLELYDAAFDPQYIKEAVRLADIMLSVFRDKESGGFYLYASDGERLITRPKEVYDGAMPSGNAAAAHVLLRLSRLTGDARWQEECDRQMRFLAANAGDYPAGHSFALLAMADALYPSSELICVSADEAVPQELRALLRKFPALNLTTVFLSPQNKADLIEISSMYAAYPVPRQGVAYYLCRNGACSAPFYDTARLAKMLED